MTFPSEGQNHTNGIKNEENIVHYMMNNPECAINKHLEKDNDSSIQLWKHEGGTKQKRDASFQLANGKTMGVSIKHHDKGTFDWINTTKGIPEFLKEEIATFKRDNMDTPIPKKGGIRDELDNKFSSYLDNLTSDDIRELLSKIYKTEEDTKYIIVNDKKSNQLILLDESNLEFYCSSNSSHQFILKKKNAKTSRQIFIKNTDGSETNTNLRIRLHLNNGITALLDKSKTSVPCLKIQQDNVDDFISKCVDKVITNYSLVSP